MHESDLSGRAAEAQQTNLQPNPNCLGEGWCLRRLHCVVHFGVVRQLACSLGLGTGGFRLPIVTFDAHISEPRVQGVVECHTSFQDRIFNLAVANGRTVLDGGMRKFIGDTTVKLIRSHFLLARTSPARADVPRNGSTHMSR